MFNASLIKVLVRDGSERPWRWTTEPVYGNGPFNPPTVAGVKQTLNGVVILLSDAVIDKARETLDAAQKAELAPWIERRDEAWAAEWHVPVWAGETSLVGLRIPAAIWNDPTSAPPAKVREYLKDVWRDIQQ